MRLFVKGSATSNGATATSATRNDPYVSAAIVALASTLLFLAAALLSIF